MESWDGTNREWKGEGRSDRRKWADVGIPYPSRSRGECCILDVSGVPLWMPTALAAALTCLGPVSPSWLWLQCPWLLGEETSLVSPWAQWKPCSAMQGGTGGPLAKVLAEPTSSEICLGGRGFPWSARLPMERWVKVFTEEKVWGGTDTVGQVLVTSWRMMRCFHIWCEWGGPCVGGCGLLLCHRLGPRHATSL